MTRISEVWGLRTDICLWQAFPNLAACERKVSKFGGCELKIFKFGGLRAKSWAKIKAVKAKISKVSQKGVLWTDTFAWNGTLANYRRGVKRGSSGPHILIPPFLVSALRAKTSWTCFLKYYCLEENENMGLSYFSKLKYNLLSFQYHVPWQAYVLTILRPRKIKSLNCSFGRPCRRDRVSQDWIMRRLDRLF